MRTALLAALFVLATDLFVVLQVVGDSGPLALALGAGGAVAAITVRFGWPLLVRSPRPPAWLLAKCGSAIFSILLGQHGAVAVNGACLSRDAPAQRPVGGRSVFFRR